MCGVPGIKLRTSPAITRTMGYGSLSLRASAPKKTTKRRSRRKTISTAWMACSDMGDGVEFNRGSEWKERGKREYKKRNREEKSPTKKWTVGQRRVPDEFAGSCERCARLSSLCRRELLGYHRSEKRRCS